MVKFLMHIVYNKYLYNIIVFSFGFLSQAHSIFCPLYEQLLLM